MNRKLSLTPLFAFFFLLTTVALQSQEFVYRTFKDTRVVNTHSSETLPKGRLDVRISHRFGDIVESAGDAEGDRVLAEVAEQLSTRLRDHDLLARLEADRFALLLAGIQLPTLFTIADAFRTVLGEVQAERFGVSRPVAGSIGVVILTRMTPSAEYALEHARIACEHAKKKGRNQTHIYLS